MDAIQQEIPRAKYLIEDDLKHILRDIKQEKEAQFSIRNIIYQTGREFRNDARNYPWWTAAKVMTLIVAGACLHPLIVGSVACFNIYRIQHWNDLYSSDIDTANTATQLYSNSGHGVGYLIEGVEIVAISAALIIRKCYMKAAARIIDSIYSKYIPQCRTIEQQNFLWELKQQELMAHGHPFIVVPKEQSPHALSVTSSMEMSSV